MTRRSRRGFTLVELLVVFIVLTILASLMVFRYIDLKHRATSVKATTDMDLVRCGCLAARRRGGRGAR
jgi:prepilin-type N-terminal cleavage/methylation domain-containing protein